MVIKQRQEIYNFLIQLQELPKRGEVQENLLKLQSKVRKAGGIEKAALETRGPIVHIAYDVGVCENQLHTLHLPEGEIGQLSRDNRICRQ